MDPGLKSESAAAAGRGSWRVGEMAQCIKVSGKPGDLSSIPRPHKVEGRFCPNHIHAAAGAPHP